MNDLWIETGSISMNKHGETLCGDKVELAANFCTGNCQKGVCVTIGDTLYSLSPETTADFFEKEVLAKL